MQLSKSVPAARMLTSGATIPLTEFQRFTMKIDLDPKDRQFLQHLHHRNGGTMQEICADQGVTATAVRQRLVRLQGMGFVERDAVRKSRGRPYFIYRPTHEGLKVLGENYAELAKTLWRAVARIESPEIREVVFANVREEMVGRFRQGVHAVDLTDRFRELGETLLQQGFDVEIDETTALPILRENNCPYLELAQQDAGICEMEQAVFTAVLGVEVHLSQCCLDGSNCCEFHVQKESA